MTRAILGHRERDVVALNRLGRAYQAVGSIDDARAAFSRALENRSREHHRRLPDAAAKGAVRLGASAASSLGGRSSRCPGWLGLLALPSTRDA